MPSRAAVFALCAAAFGAALAKESPDVDLSGFEASLAKAYPNFEDTFEKHHKPRHAALLKHAHHRHRVNVDLDLDVDAIADADDKSLEVPMRLPGRHPSVEKALDGMAGELDELNKEKLTAKNMRGELSDSVTDTMHHMNDAMSIKRAMQKKESQLRVENGKLKVLEKDAGRLEQTHDSLVTSLHRMLGPKMMFARERYEKKAVVLRKEETAARAWQEKKDQLKAGAMKSISQKKASYEALLQAEAEVAAAKKKEDLARIAYDRDRTKTAEQVQSYRYAETRHKAEVQHEKVAKGAADAARASAEKLYNVEHVEQEKVDQSILYRKDRLLRKIHQVEVERDQSKNELSGLAQKYRDWQDNQHQRTVEVMKKSQETAVASDAFASRQQQVLDAASRKVVQDAEAAGDWDGWGAEQGMFSKVADEDDDF